ncbi:hypothetical protein QBC36DRAFT_336947 [Triangularia setosa]|uniref:Zn(2)-C6 fungal-type domain-containing protein n=1 Tax=Triangularia setosa TaxID=2587417 RepID=A0AAN6W236_9PEZI|nr:hypothetical protein QBC36DRAFT_336947 [Podospora setosa]
MTLSASPSHTLSPQTVFSLPSNQKRASTPKVRTGCITCKNRHVKCDERKPTCSRCEKARMECHGYLAKTDQKTTRKSNKSAAIRGVPRPLQVIRPAPVTLFSPGKDIIYHDFFRYSLVNDLAGYLHADFWSRIVLCESIQDDCVNHAIFAIGALSQALFVDSAGLEPSLPVGPQSTGSPPSPVYPQFRRRHRLLNSHYRAAIHHQNQAISLCLRRTRDDRDRMPTRNLLIITLLLVTYELLQGDMEAADGLMTSGIRLLRDSITTLRDTASQHHVISSSNDTKDEDMEDMEYILTFLSGKSNFCPQQTTHHQTFSSVPDDNDLPVLGQTGIMKCTYLWGNFHARCILFITQAMQHTFCGQGLSAGESHSLMPEQKKLWNLLRQWHQVLSDYKAAVPAEDLRTKKIMRLLNLQCYTDFVCLAWCMDPTDAALDNCESDFSQLLKAAQEFLHDPEPISTTGFICSGGNVAGPLILIATRCRTNRGLRLKALETFRKMLWREGSWDTKVFVSVAELVILEEETRGERGQIDLINRWLWTGIHPDGDNIKVMGEYTRVMPDEKGEPVKKYLVLDLDKWGLAEGEGIITDSSLTKVGVDVGSYEYGNGHVPGQGMNHGLGLEIGSCINGGLSPASAATGTSDLDSSSPGHRECISSWDGLSSWEDSVIFSPDSMDVGDGQ